MENETVTMTVELTDEVILAMMVALSHTQNRFVTPDEAVTVFNQAAERFADTGFNPEAFADEA
jgi:hypothetical protein